MFELFWFGMSPVSLDVGPVVADHLPEMSLIAPCLFAWPFVLHLFYLDHFIRENLQREECMHIYGAIRSQQVIIIK